MMILPSPRHVAAPPSRYHWTVIILAMIGILGYRQARVDWWGTQTSFSLLQTSNQENGEQIAAEASGAASSNLVVFHHENKTTNIPAEEVHPPPPSQEEPQKVANEHQTNTRGATTSSNATGSNTTSTTKISAKAEALARKAIQAAKAKRNGPEKVIPPILIGKQENRTFAEQCIAHCLSAYQASPLIQQQPVDPNAPPRILHFVSLGDFEPGSVVNFTFLDYLVIRASYFRLQPDAIYLHMNQPAADSPHWDLIRPMISKVVHLEPITQIYGNNVTGRPHLSDILRIQVLQEYGGLYMDTDSIMLRPFSPHMWNPSRGFSLGYQENRRRQIGCGVIVARNSSEFLRLWLESYRTFDDTKWDGHSVQMASKLAQDHPELITLYPESYFYNPRWQAPEFAKLWDHHDLNETAELFPFRDNFAVHYWGNIARGHGKVERMTPSTILKEHVGIHQVLRALLPHPYFTVVVPCSDVEGVRQAIQSVVEQSFGLWEILLSGESGTQCPDSVYQDITSQLPSASKDASIRRTVDGNVTQAANGVWMLKLGAGETLDPLALDDAIEQMRTSPGDRELTSESGNQIKFIFDPERGIERVPSEYY